MEIKFKRDTAFRKQFFVPESFAHPAKMDAQLLIWIVEHYTEVGDTILDPMAGMGTTMLACILGRDVVLVELEGKFCKMMRDNWEQVKMRPQLGSTIGSCKIIQGDARQIEGLVDKIVTSPPYAEAKPGTMTEEQWAENRLRHHRSPDCEGRAITSGYPDNPNNIGNLPYGEIDKCIFSPPYADMSHPTGDSEKQRDIMAKKHHWAGTEYSDNPNNLGNLPYGQINKIVTSPPYSEGTGHKRGDNADTELLETKGIYLKGQDAYSNNKDNIGNLKNDSYLEAMLQVYQQCHLVLKPEGLMILVTKNFIRNKQVIRLDTDTIKLCEQAGFKFLERHYRKLPSQSFWRVIYHAKFPDVEQILNEDVLVFQKELLNG